MPVLAGDLHRSKLSNDSSSTQPYSSPASSSLLASLYSKMVWQWLDHAPLSILTVVRQGPACVSWALPAAAKNPEKGMRIHPRVDAITALAFMVLPDGAALQPR
jgi:hypothetical protein